MESDQVQFLTNFGEQMRSDLVFMARRRRRNGIYVQDVIQPVAEVTSRRRLRSASSSALVVPATRRSSLGDRAFSVAGPRAWNSLPEFVTDCSSLLTFKKHLKTYLFGVSF